MDSQVRIQNQRAERMSRIFYAHRHMGIAMRELRAEYLELKSQNAAETKEKAA